MSNAVAVLYDVPGPKAKARYRILTGVVAVVSLLIAFAIYRALDAKGQLTSEKWDPFLESTTWTTYLLPASKGPSSPPHCRLSSR